MKRVLLVILLTIASLIVYAQNPLTIKVKSGNYDREYLLYTPKKYSKNNPADLIVCLHGFNRTMQDFFNNYNIAGVADSLNLIVLAPQALPEQDPKVIAKAAFLKNFGIDIPLDAAWGCGLQVKVTLGIPILDEDLNKPVDDAAFIDQIVATTLAGYSIRPQNRFVFGTSMGGYMSYQYALKYGNTLSGLISICGTMGTAIKNIDAQVKVPICDFHSQTDEVVPYNGVMIQSGAVISLGQPKKDVIRTWVTKNQASVTPKEEDVHYYPSNNGITVKKFSYANPKNEVIHYQMNGANHNYYFDKNKGDCMDYNEEIIKFIRSHTTGSGTGILPVLETVQIYPNPAKDIIHLSVSEGKAAIYDRSGRRVFAQTFQSGYLDISSLDNGMYILRVESNRAIQTGKLIKIN